MFPVAKPVIRKDLDLEQIKEANKFLASLNGQSKASKVKLLHQHLSGVFVGRKPTKNAVKKHVSSRSRSRRKSREASVV